MSGSVTMPDTSIFGAILRGHTQVAKDLQELRASGELLVVPWATYNEIQQTPNPVTKAVQLTLIQELGMTVQDPTTMKQRSEVYDTFAKTSTVPKDPKSKAPAKNVIQAKDATIIADVII